MRYVAYGLALSMLATLSACEQRIVDTSAFGLPNASTGSQKRLPANIGVRKSALTLGEIPDGQELGPPALVRFWRYWGVSFPHSCVLLPEGAWVTVFEKTFPIKSTTTYVDMSLSGQFTVPSGPDTRGGVGAHAVLVQDGREAAFPGLGTEFDPWLSRRDEANNGQQTYASYQGIIGAVGGIDATIVVTMKSTDGDSWACFVNMTARMDAASTVVTDDVVDFAELVQGSIQDTIDDPETPGNVRKALRDDVLKKFNEGAKEFLKGDPKDAINKLKETIKELEEINGFDTTALQTGVALLALTELDRFIGRAEAIMGATHQVVSRAREKLSDGWDAFHADEWRDAVETAKRAAEDLEQNVAYVGSFCTAQPDDPYLSALCEMQTTHDAVVELANSHPDPKLDDARDKLEEGLARFAKLEVKEALDRAHDATKLLSEASGVDTTALQRDLAEGARDLARLYVDDVKLLGVKNQSDIDDAEAEYSRGLNDLGNGKYEKAVEHFGKAVDKARP